MIDTRVDDPATIVVCGECGAEVHRDLCECHRCAKEGRPQWRPEKPIGPLAPPPPPADGGAPDHEDWP